MSVLFKILIVTACLLFNITVWRIGWLMLHHVVPPSDFIINTWPGKAISLFLIYGLPGVLTGLLFSRWLGSKPIAYGCVIAWVTYVVLILIWLRPVLVGVYSTEPVIPPEFINSARGNAWGCRIIGDFRDIIPMMVVSTVAALWIGAQLSTRFQWK